MKKKRRPRKRIGTSLALVLAIFLALPAAARKKSVLETYAVVSGSVFDDSGYALAGAAVILASQIQPDKARGNAKPMNAVSDARGEFVLRVPPGPMQYTLTVTATGHKSQQKSISIEDQERVEVTFQLERESK